MRVMFGALSLLLVVVLIGVLAKKQLGALGGNEARSEHPRGVAVPVNTQRQQSQHLQEQVKNSVDAAIQQARPEADDK